MKIYAPLLHVSLNIFPDCRRVAMVVMLLGSLELKIGFLKTRMRTDQVGPLRKILWRGIINKRLPEGPPCFFRGPLAPTVTPFTSSKGPFCFSRGPLASLFRLLYWLCFENLSITLDPVLLLYFVPPERKGEVEQLSYWGCVFASKTVTGAESKSSGKSMHPTTK